MNFHYKIVKDGAFEEGEKDAADKFALSRAFERDGYTVITVEEESGKRVFDLKSIKGLFSRISMHDKIMFARNLGAMIEAGLSMTRSLSVMERQSKNAKFKKTLREIQGTVSKGKTLSEAMREYPGMFNSLFVSMVRAGEESGNMASALKTVATQTEKTYLLTKKVKGALTYPGVVMTIMFGIGILMMIYVVPTLTSTFKDLNVKLPASTQLIIAISDFLRNHYILFPVMLIGIVFLISYLLRSKPGKRFVDYAVLRLPIIAPMTREVNSARTARTLASLLSSGVDVVAALEVTHDVLQNSYYREVIKEAGTAIQQGKPISAVFAKREDLYPVFVSEMIAVGEETGKIGEMLLGVANFYEEEVDQKTKNLSTIIEPVLMVIIGAAVGFFAVSMITPTYSLVDAI